MFRRYHWNGRDLGGSSGYGGQPCGAGGGFDTDQCTDANSGYPLPQLTEDEILRTIAFFRYINPKADIRLAAGRALLTNDGERAFAAGASASITGNMLTTVACATIRSDRQMLENMGRDVTPDYWKEV